jgi:uncharacterized protein YfaS (alpha-2-macroglobulin family)
MRTKRIQAAVCLIAAFGIISVTGCRKDKAGSGPGPVPPPGEIKGDLKILSATPRGSVRQASEAGSVVVIFDHPMASLEALPEGKGPALMKISPDVPGRFRWLGARTLAFTPDPRFALATEFEVTVPAGIFSLDGYRLAEPYSWRFQTARPRLVSHFPADGQKSLRLDTAILLVFNQPVSDKAGAGISLVAAAADGHESAMGFEISRPSEKLLQDEEIKARPGTVLLVKPEHVLKPDLSYVVETKPGIPGTEGPLGSADGAVFGFETFKTFRFESLNAGAGHDPREPLKFLFSNPVSYAKFVQAVKFTPGVTIPDYYSEWDQSTTEIWLNLSLDPETEYRVEIPATLEDDFGNPLGRAASPAFKTAPFAPSVSMTTGFGIIEAYTDPLYPVYALNSPRFKIQAANVPKDAVIPLLTQEKIFWTNQDIQPGPDFYGYAKDQTLNLPRNKSQAVPVDLKPVVPEKYGFVFLQLDTGLPEKYEKYPKAFLQVTELGISAKFSPETNVAWVTELKSGLPVAGAEVEIRDDANAVRWRGRTDATGRAETPGWKSLGIKGHEEWSKPRQWVFVRRGKDAAFTSSEWGTGIYPYRFGIDYDWNPEPETVLGTVFTERGIYRAGETVHVKGVLRRRERGSWSLPGVKTVDLLVQDPFQKTVFKGKPEIDAFGSFAFDLDTAPEAPLGFYRIAADVPPGNPAEKAQTISGSFRVEAFRPAEFEVHVRTPEKSFVFGDDYQGEIRGDYLSGGPMAGQAVSWHLRLNPAVFTPPGRGDYVFGNEMEREESRETEESRLVASGQGTLDARGLVIVKAPLVAAKEMDPVMASLEATVASPSRRSISSRIQTIVHRGEFYIGLKPGTTFLEKGKDVTLDVIAATPDGAYAQGRKLAVRLLKRDWRSVREAGVGGRFKWHTEKEDVEVSSKSVVSGAGPVTLSFRPEKSGLYVFAASAKDGRGNPLSTSTYFYVTGGDYVSWERRDDDTVELVPDAPGYSAGQTARVLVKSPFETAKALVTIEREFIMESRIMDIPGSSTRLEIPIKPEYAPNVFVSVLLVQGRADRARPDEKQDVGKPAFKMGYAKLAVNPDEMKLAVEIARDKPDYRPRDQVRLNLKVRDPKGLGRKSCISLAVVDIGVLNLIGYETPDLFGRFYADKPLSVQTSETRLHIVGEREYGEKGEEPGGGGEKMAALSPSLTEVELRGDFKSTAYWNPSVITDGNGDASVAFDLPANLTSFRVMAVAQTADSLFGRGEDAFRVSKPIQLQPSLPRFARVGDRFEAGVVVRNFSPQAGAVSVALEAQGIACGDPGIRTFNLEPGEAREVLFPFEAERPGRARLAFRAKMNGDADGLEIGLPIQWPRPTETVALAGVTGVKAEERVVVPADAYPDDSVLDLRVSATALGGLKEGLEYLKDYPYLCLEQRLSGILPYLVASRLISNFKLSPMDETAVRAHVNAVLRSIAECQKEDGSFGLWPDSSWSSPYISCYAVFALIKAKQAGYEIDGSRLDLGAEYLKEWLRENLDAEAQPYGPACWNTVRAFALYDLAIAGRAEPAYAEKLFVERASLPLFGRTLLYKALHYGKGSPRARTTLLDEMLNTVKVTPTGAHFEEEADAGLEWIYSSNLRTTASILQALIETGSTHPLIPQIASWIVGKRQAERWHSPQEAFYVFQALNDYYSAYEKEKPDFGFKVGLDGASLLEGAFHGVDEGFRTARKPLAERASGSVLLLSFAKDGPGTLYYTARMKYAPRRKLAPEDEGFAVMKRITAVDGSPLRSIKAGSLAVVTLDVVVPRESLFVAVEDPLPAGFEAVNPDFVTESEESLRALSGLESEEEPGWSGFSHFEMRDDRVLLFADSLAAGLHTHRYLVRALTFGTFLAPGPRAEEMYAPEVFGRGAEQTVNIEK